MGGGGGVVVSGGGEGGGIGVGRRQACHAACLCPKTMSMSKTVPPPTTQSKTPSEEEEWLEGSV